MSVLIRFFNSRGRVWLVFAACVFAAYPEVIVGNRSITWDSYDYFYPKFLYISDCIRSGYFPLWNPFELSGAPFLPWNGGLLNPINLVFVLLSLVFPPHYIHQIMVLSPVFIGGVGAFSLFSAMRYSFPVAVFGGIAYSLTMFGPILGQFSIAYGIAFAPWVFYIAAEIVDSKGELSPQRICLFALAFATFIVTAYPVMIFLVCLPAALFSLFRNFTAQPTGKSMNWLPMAKSAVIILGLAGAVSSVAVFPMLENRALASEQMKGDFVSPDPRLRISISKTDAVVGYDRTIGNYLALAKGNVIWHSSFTLILFFLLIAALPRFFKNTYTPFFIILAAMFISYVEGRGGVVYEFIFNYVPLFWNNRYPVIGLSLVKFMLMMVSVTQLEHIFRIRKGGDISLVAQETTRLAIIGGMGVLLLPVVFVRPEYWAFPVSIISLAAFFYFFLKGRIPVRFFLGVLSFGLLATYYAHRDGSYYKKNSEERKFSRVRKITPEYNSNLRTLVKSHDYVFYDRTWVFSKVPSNQGYYMADIPAYWYMKNLDVLHNVFYLSDNVKLQSAEISRQNYNSDNDFMDALVGQVLSSSGTISIVDRVSEGFVSAPSKSVPGVLSDVKVRPNEFSVTAELKSSALLVLTDKYYPGWKVYADGIMSPIVKTNICFKGVYLSSGKHHVRFVFRPISFYAGLTVTFVTLFSMGLFCAFTRRRHIQKVPI